MSQISQKDVEHLAKLARIGLTENEKQNFTKQIDEILGYVKKVGNYVSGKNEKENFRLKNVVREDSANNLSVFENAKNQQEMFKNVPEKEGDFFKVPGVFE